MPLSAQPCKQHCLPAPSLARFSPPQVDFKQEGEWPTYGNDDDRVDSIARDLVRGGCWWVAVEHTADAHAVD